MITNFEELPNFRISKWLSHVTFPSLWCGHPLIFTTRVDVCRITVLICISLMTNNDEHLFRCLVAIQRYSLMCLLKSFACLKIMVFSIYCDNSD